ncbi:MAG: hypothetical protein PHS59_03045 [Paludibacter sp.]|nr:hypothetical protein [Paludibacter sp.]
MNKNSGLYSLLNNVKVWKVHISIIQYQPIEGRRKASGDPYSSHPMFNRRKFVRTLFKIN